MSNENVDMDALLAEFQVVCRDLDEVLKDLEWRKPDVIGEEAKLKQLRKAALKDPDVDVASQAIVCRVARAILNDKIAEANRLEKRMLELKAQLEKAEATVDKPEGGEQAGSESEAEERLPV